MSEKAKILAKILSLYLITSLLFLGYFFKTDYDMKKEALILGEVKNLKEIKMGIYMQARINGLDGVRKLTQDKGVKTCILMPGNKIFYADESCENPAQNIFIKDGRVAIFEPIQSMDANASDGLALANIVLTGKSVRAEILTLRIKTALNLCASLAAIMIVAFFLARLALMPLYAKIAALNRFIKDSTHEIKTPLSVILMSIETTDKSNFNERNLKRLNNIELAAKSLSAIYDGLVMLSFNAKKHSKKELIDLKKLTTQRLEYFAPFFAKRKLNLSIKLDPASINANQEEMPKILDNLLANTVKYTNLGGYVQVILRQNYLEITNSGEGIDKAAQSKIFERYVRFNEDAGGFGIGLALVKQCCEKNGIKVSCQSEPQKETKFTLVW